jgi:hypothetical protein
MKAPVMVYPNPVSAGASVSIEGVDEGSMITVVNSMGKIVKTVQAAKEITSVSMPSVQGIYLIRVADSNGSQGFKVIVK